jgi:hypothetical protein
VYNLSASASTNASIGGLVEDVEAKANEHEKCNGRFRVDEQGRELIIRVKCDNTGMSSRALAFEFPPAVSYIVLFLLFLYVNPTLYNADDHLLRLAFTSVLHILDRCLIDRFLRRSSHNPQPSKM